MSVQAASDFFNKLYTDESMRKSLESEMGNLEHPDNTDAARRNFGESISAAGSKNGFDFTPDEAKDAYKMFLGRFAGNLDEGETELSDAELTSVAGGQKPVKSGGTFCGHTCGG